MSRFKTVVITGANRGLGLEFAQHYSKHANRVIACCRQPDQAEALNILIKEKNNTEIFTLDVTRLDQAKALQTYLDSDPIDLLINNAGVGASRQTDAIFDTKAWLEVFTINAIAPIQISTVLADNLSKSHNSIVANITSKMGSIADNTSGGAEIYRSSKAALNAASKSFALAHQPLGITTVLLHPGWVQTDMGGPNGLIDTQTSVAGMTNLLEDIKPSQNGCFYDYLGNSINW